MLARSAFVLAIFFMLLCHALSVGAADADGARRIATLLPKDARWALVVTDLHGGGETALGNALDEPLVPGSVAKLFVTGAVLDRVARGERPEAFLPTGWAGKRKKGGREIRGGERLQRLLRDMNVHSRNRTAEALFLRLGERRFGGPPSREKGREALLEFLSGLGLDTSEVALVDGSGLARENLLPPRFVARYLAAIARKPWFERFRATLPRAGLEGTVKDIGHADWRFRVKSGRLDNAFALAGYGVAPAGREVAFAFIVNVPAGRRITDRRHSRGTVVRMIGRGVFR